MPESNYLVQKFQDSFNTGYIAPNAYFECTTAADTAAKVATSPNSVIFTDTSLITGVTVFVHFTNTNTASSPSLQIGTSTAQYLYRTDSSGAGTWVGETVAGSWKAGAVVSVTYDGHAWVINDHSEAVGSVVVGSTTLYPQEYNIITQKPTGSVDITSAVNTLIAANAPVTDVQVDSTSVVTSGVANIDTSGLYPKSGGNITGDVTLYKAGSSPGDSYSLIFQRGTLSDNFNDWRLQDRGGFLYFDQRGSGSTSWGNQVIFNTSGNITATTFTGSGANLTSLDASNISSGTLNSARLPSGLEYTSRMVTSIDSSSTDSQYPSAKAVYDLFVSITDADSVAY